MTTLALDIGGTKLAAALVADHRVIAEVLAPTDLSAGPEGLVERLADLAAPWAGRFSAVGAAVTGVVKDGLWRALNPTTLPLPGPFPLQARLEARFARPVHAVNDAQAAAWGEWVVGAGARQEDMVFLTVSTGIGGGIVAGGALLGGIAGHFGQWLMADGSRLEDGAAGRWMAARAAALGHDVDAAGVFARAGEPWADAIIEESACRVARLCCNIQLALDPARIVIGGGIGLAPGYRQRLETALAEVAPALRPRLAAAALGARAGLVGAAALATAPSTLNEARENA